MRDGYKNSEIGIIPVDWQILPFYECVEIVNGQVDPKVSPYKDMPHISPDCISKGTGQLLEFRTAGEDGVKSGKYIFGPKDVLYSKIRPNLNKVAYPKFPGLCSADMYPITAFDSVTSPEFIFFSLLSKRFVEFATSVSTRTGIPKINREELSTYRFAIPPLPEQQKIADILTTVDDHISETEALIEKTKVLKQGLMQQLLTKGIGHTEFKDTEIGRIPVEWEVRTVGSLGSTYNGLSGKSKNDFGSGSPFITYKSIFDSSLIDLTRVEYVQVSPNENQNTAKYGDLFFTTSSETPDEVGMCSALLEDTGILYLNSFCFGYRIKSLDQFDPNFARYMFRGNYFRRTISKIGQGSTRYNLSKTAMMQVKIPLPPLPEQRQIAAILTSVDDQIDTYQAKLASLTRLKTGLMQQLLTGKIRVKV